MINLEPVSRVLILDANVENPKAEQLLKALDSLNRLRILRYLWDRAASVSDLAAALELPASTVALHVEILEEAGLIKTEMAPASRGVQKVCTRMFDRIVVELPVFDRPHEQAVEINMPIGAYVDCEVSSTCGLASETAIIGFQDDPTSFYEPNHLDAQLIWFRYGYLEYRFPNRLPQGVTVETLSLSMEICSEAPNYNLDWPSDITLWINGVEIGSWTCPGDFGGEHGRLTPDWWPSRYTQYGLFKVWHVNSREAEIDGMRISGVTIHNLKLEQSRFISVRLGVKPEAGHVGGLNLFGSRFGNYPQDLVMRLGYRSPSA